MSEANPEVSDQAFMVHAHERQHEGLMGHHIDSRVVTDILEDTVTEVPERSIYFDGHGWFMPHPDKPLPYVQEGTHLEIQGYWDKSGREGRLIARKAGIGRTVMSKLYGRPKLTRVDIEVGDKIVNLRPHRPLADAGVSKPAAVLYRNQGC